MSFSEIIQRRPWRRGTSSSETLRQLAFEVTMRAAALVGEDGASIEPERVTTTGLLAAARDSLEIAGQHSRDIDREIDALRMENARLRRVAQAGNAGHRDPGGRPDPPAIARELIAIADRLASQQGAAAPRWLNRSITRLLAQSEIYLIEDEGEVDPTRHEVIEVRRVTENERVNRIAATVRPGYGWRGQILRPQEVVAYVLGDPA